MDLQIYYDIIILSPFVLENEGDLRKDEKDKDE